MAPLILGLGNKARHGKDSFAQAIEAYYKEAGDVFRNHALKFVPVKVQRVAFADALYNEVNEYLAVGKNLGIPNNELFSMGVREVRGGEIVVTPLPEWVKPSHPPLEDPRAPYGKHPKLLQWWGTEFRRAQDDAYWIKRWKVAIDPKADIVIATDMRFENEAQAIKDVGGYTVRVNRLNVDGTPYVDPGRDRYHASETQLDGYNVDYQITVKTGDLVLLEEWAITLVHFLRARAQKEKQ